MRNPRTLALGVLAVAALLALPSASLAAKAKPKWHTLTLTANPVDRGWIDVGPIARSKGDVFVLSAPLTDASGARAGTLVQACTIADDDLDGRVVALCTFSATITGRGELVATGANLLVSDATGASPNGVTIAARAQFAITGGTGAFAGASGVLTNSAAAGGRTLSFRYR